MGDNRRSRRDDWLQLPSSELTISVAIAPTPDIPLASLRHSLTAIYDDRERLVDWELASASLLDHGALVEFRRWRDSWKRVWPIGSIDNVAALLRETVAIEHDLGRSLDHLLERVTRAGGATVNIAAELVPSLRHELATVRLALSVDDRTSIGIIDDMPTSTRGDGLARVWAPADAVTVLAATPELAVVLQPGAGLGLVYAGGVNAHEPAITAPPTEFTGVTAVDMRADTVVVLNDRGSSMRLSQAEARALGWIVPRSLRWHVREIPILLVWAQLFDAFFTAFDAAEQTSSSLRIEEIAFT